MFHSPLNWVNVEALKKAVKSIEVWGSRAIRMWWQCCWGNGVFLPWPDSNSRSFLQSRSWPQRVWSAPWGKKEMLFSSQKVGRKGVILQERYYKAARRPFLYHAWFPLARGRLYWILLFSLFLPLLTFLPPPPPSPLSLPFSLAGFLRAAQLGLR